MRAVPARSSVSTMAATAAGERTGFGAGELFLADSRLAFVVLNELRYRAMRRVFGVSREQANLLTFAVALVGFEGAVTTAGRVIRAPLQISRMDVAMGGFMGREAAIGVAGPSAAEVSPFATLMTIAVVGGLALPTLRRTARRLRAAERRLRTLRESQYANARRATEARLRARRNEGRDVAEPEVA
jgi:hypothetical protein